MKSMGLLSETFFKINYLVIYFVVSWKMEVVGHKMLRIFVVGLLLFVFGLLYFLKMLISNNQHLTTEITM
jgi:hypothetical protein